MKKGKVVIPEPKKREDGSWTSRIEGEWLPIPFEALELLGLKEGSEVELVPLTGDSHVKQLIIRRKDSTGAARERTATK